MKWIFLYEYFCTLFTMLSMDQYNFNIIKSNSRLTNFTNDIKWNEIKVLIYYDIKLDKRKRTKNSMPAVFCFVVSTNSIETLYR